MWCLLLCRRLTNIKLWGRSYQAERSWYLSCQVRPIQWSSNEVRFTAVLYTKLSILMERLSEYGLTRAELGSGSWWMHRESRVTLRLAASEPLYWCRAPVTRIQSICNCYCLIVTVPRAPVTSNQSICNCYCLIVTVPRAPVTSNQSICNCYCTPSV
jgi:hypothetical protein